MKNLKILFIFTVVTIPSMGLRLYLKFVSYMNYRFEYSLKEEIVQIIDECTTAITHKASSGKNVKFILFNPNTLCSQRAATFSSKEPETLDWIEEFGCGEKILFDIGANIGLYSIYHSKLNNGKSFAFEPSFFNLKLLAKNINKNELSEFITVLQIPLSDSSGVNSFIDGGISEGGALNAFGVNYGFNGESINPQMRTNILGLSLDDMFNWGFLVDIPNLIKIDVDGIEHLILRGATNTLSSPNCRSVLVEVNDGFKEQAIQVKSILEGCGFKLREIKQSELMAKNDFFCSTNNQIWIK